MFTGAKHRTVGVHSVTGHNWRPGSLVESTKLKLIDLTRPEFSLVCMCGYCNNGMEIEMAGAGTGFLFCNFVPLICVTCVLVCVSFGDILFRM